MRFLKAKLPFILFFLLTLFLVSSCAKVSPNAEQLITNEAHGFWHGFIVPFSFMGSLFNDDIAIYGVNNDGAWYDFGFVLGVLIFGGGGSRANRRR